MSELLTKLTKAQIWLKQSHGERFPIERQVRTNACPVSTYMKNNRVATANEPGQEDQLREPCLIPLFSILALYINCLGIDQAFGVV